MNKTVNIVQAGHGIQAVVVQPKDDCNNVVYWYSRVIAWKVSSQSDEYEVEPILEHSPGSNFVGVQDAYGVFHFPHEDQPYQSIAEMVHRKWPGAELVWYGAPDSPEMSYGV